MALLSSSLSEDLGERGKDTMCMKLPLEIITQKSSIGWSLFLKYFYESLFWEDKVCPIRYTEILAETFSHNFYDFKFSVLKKSFLKHTLAFIMSATAEKAESLSRICKF